MLTWISDRDPFLVHGENLQSLSTGLVSSLLATVSSRIWLERIKKGLDKMTYHVSQLKGKIKSSLYHIYEIVSKLTDPKSFFHRMITMAERQKNLQPFFQYELTVEPMVLFQISMMRQPDKPSLRKIIMLEEDACQKNEIEQNCHCYTEFVGKRETDSQIC